MSAQASTGPCDIRWRAAYYQDGDTHPVRRIVRCAVERWSVPGGVRMAMCVIAHESGFRPDASRGSSNPNKGVMQHNYHYWPERVRKYLRRWWPDGVSIYSARANVITGIRMAHDPDIGWEPWSARRFC